MSKEQAVKWTDFKMRRCLKGNLSIKKVKHCHFIVIKFWFILIKVVFLSTLIHWAFSKYHIIHVALHGIPLCGAIGVMSVDIYINLDIRIFLFPFFGGYRLINLAEEKSIICSNNNLSRFIKIMGMNNKGNVIGVAKTIFGELHAVLLTEIK